MADSGCGISVVLEETAAVSTLWRKNDDSGVAGGIQRTIKITVIEIKNGRMRLGIEADADVRINRFEVWERNSSESGPAIHNIVPVD